MGEIMFNYRGLRIGLFVAMILMIIACNITVNPKPKLPPLRIVYDSWPGFSPLIIAKEKGFFAQQGVEVEIIYTQNALDALPQFNDHKYDGIAIALGNILTSVNHPDISIILACDVSDGADAVLANPKISSIRDLKGKRIGTRIGTFGELFITKMLESQGMTADDVFFSDADGEGVIQQIKKGQIDAGNAWEPFVSKGIKAGLKVLFSSQKTPGLIPDIIAIHSNLLTERSHDIRAFVKAWFQGVNYWQKYPKEAKTIIAKVLNLEPESISLEGINLLDLDENRQAFTPGNTTESLKYTTELYIQFFAKKGLLNNHPNAESLLNSSFLD
jgi:NitT/TauT family transport system substrate-binding protein